MLAAVLESDDHQRLYMGLSLLVSAATEGREARALLGFGALTALFEPPLPRHVLLAEREPFARTLAELRDTALELCTVHACAAAAQATGADTSRLAGVISTPQFLREVADAELIFV
jgi:peroxiredoxin family protein